MAGRASDKLSMAGLTIKMHKYLTFVANSHETLYKNTRRLYGSKIYLLETWFRNPDLQVQLPTIH